VPYRDAGGMWMLRVSSAGLPFPTGDGLTGAKYLSLPYLNRRKVSEEGKVKIKLSDIIYNTEIYDRPRTKNQLEFFGSFQ
jgi:hypothetical protein